MKRKIYKVLDSNNHEKLCVTFCLYLSGIAAQNMSNVNTRPSTVTNVVNSTNNVNANISVANSTNANVNKTINDPDTVSVDGPTKMPVVNATATDDGQSVDESER